MKKTRGHIPWSDVDARLRSLREIRVATSSPKGRPDATPVWFWWDGEAVDFTCAAVANKARNIAAQPEVVLLNGDGADPIIIKGRAERVTDRDELERVDRAYAEKYVAPSTGRARQFHCRRPRLPRAPATRVRLVVRNGRDPN